MKETRLLCSKTSKVKYLMYFGVSFPVLLFMTLGLPNKLDNEINTKYINPTSTVNISNTLEDTRFNLKIPKIDVETPILVGVDPTNKESYESSLTQGVALMQGSSLPGMNGNIFIYGHSSANVKSPYEKIFSTLNNLIIGDQIIVYYKHNNFTYTVNEKKVINKDDLSVLQPTSDEILTLMTCWPIDTSERRLVIISLREKE